MPREAYLTFEAGLTKTGTRGEPCALTRLRKGPMCGATISRGRPPRTPCLVAGLLNYICYVIESMIGGSFFTKMILLFK